MVVTVAAQDGQKATHNRKKQRVGEHHHTHLGRVRNAAWASMAVEDGTRERVKEVLRRKLCTRPALSHYVLILERTKDLQILYDTSPDYTQQQARN
jgi:hypothetical protein